MFARLSWRLRLWMQALRKPCPFCDVDLPLQAQKLLAECHYIGAVATARCHLVRRLRETCRGLGVLKKRTQKKRPKFHWMAERLNTLEIINKVTFVQFVTFDQRIRVFLDGTPRGTGPQARKLMDDAFRLSITLDQQILNYSPPLASEDEGNHLTISTPKHKKRSTRTVANCIQAVLDGRSFISLKNLNAELDSLGVDGSIAASLVRTKEYSNIAKRLNDDIKEFAYTRKDESMRELCELLSDTDYKWGWGVDPEEKVATHILYINLPTGQVSFHSTCRREGPEYLRPWDMKRRSGERIANFAGLLLTECEREPLSSDKQSTSKELCNDSNSPNASPRRSTQ